MTGSSICLLKRDKYTSLCTHGYPKFIYRIVQKTDHRNGLINENSNIKKQKVLFPRENALLIWSWLEIDACDLYLTLSKSCTDVNGIRDLGKITDWVTYLDPSSNWVLALWMDSRDVPLWLYSTFYSVSRQHLEPTALEHTILCPLTNWSIFVWKLIVIWNNHTHTYAQVK